MGLTRQVNKQLESLIGQNPIYSANPFAAQQLTLAQNAYNDPSMGTRAQSERNIQSSGANFNNQVDRNATSGSQALALAAAGQGQTDNAISNENLDFMKNKTNLLSNLNNAYQTNINEGDKVFQDQTRRYGDMVQIKGAEAANKFAKQKTILNAGLSLASLGFGGGFGKGFGGGGQQNNIGSGGFSGSGINMPITSWSQLQGPLNIDYSQIGSSYPK